MKFLGLDLNIKNVPVLDESFIPLDAFNSEFLKTAKKPIAIAVERNNDLVSVYETFIHGSNDMFETDCYYIERLIKFLLWAKGGYKVYVCGDENIAFHMSGIYCKNGKRSFDVDFMSKVYEKEFEIVYLLYNQKPDENEKSNSIGRHLDGCRIGFDAGGSDRKVSAVIDGQTVYSEEMVWFPKTNSNPDYHYKGIVDSLKIAASKMPRVDAIGISSAGIYIDNRTMVASLFLNVSNELFEKKVKDIYIRAAKEIGNAPVVVVNDGDVTALAGAMDLNDTNVLGIAMGTSEAGGYVDSYGNITGWLNEFAFAPVDAQEMAMEDEWSGDIGCGVKYFSQDAVIKLAPKAGIVLSDSLSPAEKLKHVQKLLESNHPCAIKIYETIGCYLGHSLNLYAKFYKIKHVLLLGRVMSGEGGNIILKVANQVLESEYIDLYKSIKIHLPDEGSRRVGQSVAAASLPYVGLK